MTGPLYRLGGFCSRHHWPVIAGWLVAVIATALVAGAAGEKTSDNLTLSGTGSTNAQNLLSDHLPTQANGTNPVVMQAESGKITDSKNKQAVEDTVKSLRKVDIVQRAVSPFSDAGKGAISKDKQIAYISVTLTESKSDLTDEEAQTVVDATSPAEDAGLKVATGGYLGQAVSKADTESSEAIGLLAAVVILMFAFGTVTAMILPIVTAVLGLVASLAIIKLLGHVIDVPSVAPTLATMIGLGVGIDYALFIVTRHKLQLKDGMEMRESIARAAATAGGAGVVAGPGRGDRPRVFHPPPPQAAAEGRDGDARVDRARGGHGWRCGRVRGDHRGDRAGLAGVLGHPFRRQHGLQRGRGRAGRRD